MSSWVSQQKHWLIRDEYSESFKHTKSMRTNSPIPDHDTEPTQIPFCSCFVDKQPWQMHNTAENISDLSAEHNGSIY